MSNHVPEYGFKKVESPHGWAHIRSGVERLLPTLPAGARVLDLGCGTGYVAGWLVSQGFTVVGIDPSHEGVALARAHSPKGRFEVALAEPGLLQQLGEQPFDLVVSTEVVEHLYAPRGWAQCAFEALKPGGTLVCSTPYHGYLKNLALAALDKWDSHHSPMWDGGHIKFWSRKTLTELLESAGFRELRFVGVGRAPYLWMSMVMSGVKPR